MTNLKPLTIQPIPYQGSKRSLAPRICQLIPNSVETLYEPFAGSAAISLFCASHRLAERFVIGDSFHVLIDLWEMIIEHPTEVSERYERLWAEQFSVGPDHFRSVRDNYNTTPDPVLLLYLVARCVKNAVRFNRHGHFTQSADKRRTGMKPDRMTRNVHAASRLLKGRTTLHRGDFARCVEGATPSDLVYMDPPYQGTTYGADKRYANQLEREHLIVTLEDLDMRRIPYILSYDGRCGDKTYGEPLPDTLRAHHVEIIAGRSSQATLNGQSSVTVESLYISHGLELADMSPRTVNRDQLALFS